MKCFNSKCNHKATHIRVGMHNGTVLSYDNQRAYCKRHIAKLKINHIAKDWYLETITLEEYQLYKIKERL